MKANLLVPSIATAASAFGMALMATPYAAAAGAAESLRPFRVSVPQAALDDLRRRIAATQWPEKETVADSSQGVPLATMRELARYWATEYDWRKVEAKLNALAAVRHRDRWAGHSLHSCSLEARQRAAADRHARVAGLDHRAAEDHRSARRIPPRTAARAEDAFDVVIPSMPGYGFSGKPTSTGWGPERMGTRLGNADEAPRLHALRRAGRRLGRVRRRPDGPAGACGIARHPHQHACHGSGGRRQGAPRRQPAASRPLGRGTARL